MANEIVSSNGVFVAGTFQDPAWVKDTFQLTDGNMDQIYQFTTKIVPAEYQYKYYNGDGGDPDGEDADFETAGCGVSNGIGGWNRLLDITGQLTDTILPVYDYNTCNISVNIEDAVNNPAFFEVFPESHAPKTRPFV